MTFDENGDLVVFMQPAKLKSVKDSIADLGSGIYRMRHINPRLRHHYMNVGRVKVVSPGSEPVYLKVASLQDLDHEITRVEFVRWDKEDWAEPIPVIMVPQEDFIRYFNTKYSDDKNPRLVGTVTTFEAIQLITKRRIKVMTPNGSEQTIAVKGYTQTLNQDGSVTVRIWRDDK